MYFESLTLLTHMLWLFDNLISDHQ